MVIPRQTHGNPICAEEVIGIRTLSLIGIESINKIQCEKKIKLAKVFEKTTIGSKKNNIVIQRQAHGNPVCAEEVIGIGASLQLVSNQSTKSKMKQ